MKNHKIFQKIGRLIRKSRGFTLMELVMTIVIMAILLGTLGPLYRTGLTLFLKTNEITQGSQSARIAFNRLVHDLKTISVINDCTYHSIDFDDIDGNNIVYELSGTDLLRNDARAMNHVQNLWFVYYDRNNNWIWSPETDDLWVVRVIMDIDVDENESRFTAEVSPRNLHSY